MYLAVARVLVFPWILCVTAASVEVPESKNVADTEDTTTFKQLTETRKALYEITPVKTIIGNEENNQIARQPESEGLCQNADFLVQILNAVIPLLAKNVSGRFKTTYIIQILNELIKSSPETIQDDEVMYKLNDLLSTLEKKASYNNILKISGKNTDVDDVISKINYIFEIPPLSNEKCTAELLSIIKTVQKGIFRLINNPICKDKVHKTRSPADINSMLFENPHRGIPNHFITDYLPYAYKNSEQNIPLTSENLFVTKSNLDWPTVTKHLDLFDHPIEYQIGPEQTKTKVYQQESPIYGNYQEYLERNYGSFNSKTYPNTVPNPYKYNLPIDSLYKNQDFLYEESNLSAEDTYPQNVNTYPTKPQYPKITSTAPYLFDVDHVDYSKKFDYGIWPKSNINNDMLTPEVSTWGSDVPEYNRFKYFHKDPKYPPQARFPDYVPITSDESPKWHDIYNRDLNFKPGNPQVYIKNTNWGNSPFQNNLPKEYELPTEDSSKYLQQNIYHGSLDTPNTEFEPEIDIISSKKDAQNAQVWYGISNFQKEYPIEFIYNINSRPSLKVKTINSNENLYANKLPYYDWETDYENFDSKYPSLSISDLLTKRILNLDNNLHKGDQNQILQLITTNRPNIMKNSRDYNANILGSYETDNIDQHILQTIKENTKFIERNFHGIHQNEISHRYIEKLKSLINRSNIKIQDFASIVSEYEHLIQYIKYLQTSNEGLYDVDQSTLHDGESNVIEFTYLVKRPTPIVYQPYYYVKYQLPYTSFVAKVQQILREKPYLKSEPTKLYNELTELSNLAETSPDLNKLKKEDIVKLTSNNGTLLAAKLVPTEDGDVYKKLDMLKEFHSDASLDDINRLINNARRDNSQETKTSSMRGGFNLDDNKKSEKFTSSKILENAKSIETNKIMESVDHIYERNQPANKKGHRDPSTRKYSTRNDEKYDRNMTKTLNKDEEFKNKLMMRENIEDKPADSMASKIQRKSKETELLDATLNAHKFEALDTSHNSKNIPRNPKTKGSPQNINSIDSNNNSITKTVLNTVNPSVNAEKANINGPNSNKQSKSVGLKLLEATIDAHSKHSK